MNVSTCNGCATPIVAVHRDGGFVILELKDVPGGEWEIVNKIAQRRLKQDGTPRTGGRGLRIHRCPLLTPKADAPTRLTPRGQHVAQEAVEAPPEPPYRMPVVLIELQDLLGTTQAGPKGEPSEYVDWTGPLGRSSCAVCNMPIVACLHPTRPDGTRPVLLHGVTHHTGPWRLYAKQDAPTTPIAEFVGSNSDLAGHYNHRVLCPGARHA